MTGSLVVLARQPVAELPGSGLADLPQARRLGALEAVIFASVDPPTLEELSEGLGVPVPVLEKDLRALADSYSGDSRGIRLQLLAGRYRLLTKPEYHESVRSFAESLRPRVKLSAVALETLAIIAFRQPVTIPEIGSIRGVANPGGVIRTLLRHRLIATAGRRKVVGRPMLYKTTDEFLDHFGLQDLSELPTLKEVQRLAGAPEGIEKPSRFRA